MWRSIFASLHQKFQAVAPSATVLEYLTGCVIHLNPPANPSTLWKHERWIRYWDCGHPVNSIEKVQWTCEDKSTTPTIIKHRCRQPKDLDQLDTEFDLLLTVPPHPHLVFPFAAGFSLDEHKEPGLMWLAFPWANGGSLNQCEAKKSDDLLLSQLICFQGLVEGLNHLHSHNMLHNDLEARNVLVHGPHLLIGDFGVSCSVPDLQNDIVQRLNKDIENLGYIGFRIFQNVLPNILHSLDQIETGSIMDSKVNCGPKNESSVFANNNAGAIVMSKATEQSSVIEQLYTKQTALVKKYQQLATFLITQSLGELLLNMTQKDKTTPSLSCPQILEAVKNLILKVQEMYQCSNSYLLVSNP
jgi:serine/threonine protein kinase